MGGTPAIFEGHRCTACAVLLKENTMFKLYRVDVQWGDKKIKHYASSKFEAYMWIGSYQRISNDILAIARNRITGQRIGHSIYR